MSIAKFTIDAKSDFFRKDNIMPLISTDELTKINQHVEELERENALLKDCLGWYKPGAPKKPPMSIPDPDSDEVVVIGGTLYTKGHIIKLR